MPAFVITPPPQLITTAEAKADLKVEYNAEDSLIDICCKMAQNYIENETHRLIGERTAEYYFERWPCSRELEFYDSPIKSVTYVKYLDANGVEQTLSSDKYYFVRDYKSKLWLKSNESWPTLADHPRPITVRFVGGFKRNADTAQGEIELPAELLKAMLLLVNHYYEHRGLVYTGLQLREYPENLVVKAMCAHYMQVSI